MEEIHFFEYSIQLKHCKIIKYKCIGTKIREGVYDTKFYNCNDKDTGNHRLVKLEQFEKINSLRIISFTDDYEYYRQLLLEKYESIVKQSQEKLEKQETFLQALKKSCTTP